MTMTVLITHLCTSPVVESILQQGIDASSSTSSATRMLVSGQVALSTETVRMLNFALLL